MSTNRTPLAKPPPPMACVRLLWMAPFMSSSEVRIIKLLLQNVSFLKNVATETLQLFNTS